MKTKNLILICTVTIITALVSSCFNSRQATKPVSVVKNVDLNKYQGKWYEIARFPHFFQRSCVGSYAEYKIIDETHISVKNTCFIKNSGGDKKHIFGKATVVDGSNSAKLKVRFDKFPANLFAGDYWVTMLDENYGWVVVTDSVGEYLWVLSRTPKMSDSTYNHIYSELIKKGFKVEFLKTY